MNASINAITVQTPITATIKKVWNYGHNSNTSCNGITPALFGTPLMPRMI